MKNRIACITLIVLCLALAAVLIAQNIPGAPPKPRARAVKLSTPQVLEAYVVAVLDGDTVDVVKDQQKTRIRRAPGKRLTSQFSKKIQYHPAESKTVLNSPIPYRSN